jgi:hypothetical protein
VAANQVVLYFERPEDALLFTLAASSVMSAEGPAHTSKAAAKIAEEICKASRITTEGSVNAGADNATAPKAKDGKSR